MLTTNSKVLLQLLAVVLFISLSLFQLYYYYRPFNPEVLSFQTPILPTFDRTDKVDGTKCQAWQEFVYFYRRCLLKSLYRNSFSAWDLLHQEISNCLGAATFDMLNITYLPNKDDVKLIITPEDRKSKCVEVTLGIGNDTESELLLLNLIPGCRMYGADPLASAGQIFEKIGKYFEMAVGARNGVFNANVLVGPGIWDYAVKKVQTISFTDFFVKNIKEKRIDYVFMDNEGGEYEFLPFLTNLTAIGIEICQMSIELHGPLHSYKMNPAKFVELMRDIVRYGSMIPVWSSKPAIHIRMFVLNVESEYCIEKYLSSWCN